MPWLMLTGIIYILLPPSPIYMLFGGMEPYEDETINLENDLSVELLLKPNDKLIISDINDYKSLSTSDGTLENLFKNNKINLLHSDLEQAMSLQIEIHSDSREKASLLGKQYLEFEEQRELIIDRLTLHKEGFYSGRTTTEDQIRLILEKGKYQIKYFKTDKDVKGDYNQIKISIRIDKIAEIPNQSIELKLSKAL